MVGDALNPAAESLHSSSRLPTMIGRKLAVMCRRESRSQRQLLSHWILAIWQSSVATQLGGGSFRADTENSSKLDDTFGQNETPYIDALQRPSFFDPRIDDEAPRRYTLQTDLGKLRRIGGTERRLVTSWTTGGPKRWSIAHNLALSIRRNTPHLEKHFVFIALDPDAVQRAEQAGFNAVLNEGGVDMQDDIWKMRWLIQTTCISLDLEVLVVDSDIVFLSDPFLHFFHDADMEAMTDHFFPADQLWASWLRPAEHINTGFILARPSPRLLAFLVEFIDSNYYNYEGPTPRDGMDQRVFNKFVFSKFDAQPPEVIGLYDDLAFHGLDWQATPRRFLPRNAWKQPRGKGGSPISIRLLDPVCISHGMNYFWRKAYKLGSCGGVSGALPAVVHVNGVDPKMYFLRDRNLWYVDDWEERFGKSPSFLLYRHPTGLSLKEDFEHVVAALEVGAYFRRRVVLPETMNCGNCPAYNIYRLNETMVDEPGCTYDFFAHANGLYEVYSRVKPYAVEAGAGREARFQELLAVSSGDLAPMTELQQTGLLREEVLAIQQVPSAAVFNELRVLRISEDILMLRDALRLGAFGFRMNAERVFSCAYQQPLIGAMACLDEPYVEEFGSEAMCPASDFQEGCGPVGICCCWPFWGWGEKLQYFTGVPWDLPCNCGIDVCQQYERPLQDHGSEQCCRHSGSDALFPQTDPGVFYCKTEGDWQGVTGAEDSYTYTSSALIDFAQNKRSPQQTFETCRLDRMLRRGDLYREMSLRECNLQVTAYLLRRFEWEQLQKWLDWQFHERRGVANASLVIMSMDSNQTDNTGFVHGKLSHDLEQLEFIVSRFIENASPNMLDHAQMVSTVLPGFRHLANLFELYRAGQTSRGDVEQAFENIRPFFNRALHVPAVTFLGTVWSENVDFLDVEASVRKDGHVVVDGVLTEALLEQLQLWFAGSTVWHRSLQEGSVLKAQIRDGLHAELGFKVARELAAHMPGLLGKQPVLDILAYKHGEGSAGLGAHCIDGLVAAMIWVAPEDANLGSHINGLRVFDSPSSAEVCKGVRVGPQPAASLEAAPQHAHSDGESHSFIPFQSNRLVLWQAAQAVEIVHDGFLWTKEFPNRRVDWIIVFGRPQSDSRKEDDYVPSFEGKSDSWGGHYYARDHDHR